MDNKCDSCFKLLCESNIITCSICWKGFHGDCYMEALFIPSLNSVVCFSCRVRTFNPRIEVIKEYQSSSNFNNIKNLAKIKIERTKQPTSQLMIICFLAGDTIIRPYWPNNSNLIIKECKGKAKTIYTVLAEHHKSKFSICYSAFFISDSEEANMSYQLLPKKVNYYETKSLKFEISLSSIKNEYIDDRKFYFIAAEVKFLYRKQVYDSLKIRPKHYVYDILSKGNKEIQVRLNKINLVDIYSNKAIISPGRGIFCTHEQPICIKSFIKVNKNTKLLRCPICKKNMVKMYIDGTLLKVIYDLILEKKNLLNFNIIIEENYECKIEEVVQPVNEITNKEIENIDIIEDNENHQPHIKTEDSYHDIQSNEEHNDIAFKLNSSDTDIYEYYNNNIKIDTNRLRTKEKTSTTENFDDLFKNHDKIFTKGKLENNSFINHKRNRDASNGIPTDIIILD